MYRTIRTAFAMAVDSGYMSAVTSSMSTSDCPQRAPGGRAFAAVFTPPAAFEVSGLTSNPHRFTAKLSYRAKPFASVPIEVSPVEAGNADSHDRTTSDALALVGLPTNAAVPCMTMPWQVAQKLHACTATMDPPRTNDRAHDLVDLQLLEALLVDETLGETRVACIGVLSARAGHEWPPRLVAQGHWGPIYSRALEGIEDLGLAPNLDQAVERVQSFVDRIDASNS